MPIDERRVVSAKQEREAAKRLGAKQHNGSGSGARAHDMHTDRELIECKTVLSGNKQITIKSGDLKSLVHQAAVQDLDPVVHIRVNDCPIKNWVMIPEGDYRPRI